MVQDMIVTCNRCALTVPINQTTYDNGGKSLICFDCYNKIVQGLETGQYKIIQSGDVPKRLNYRCSFCNFEVSRSENFTVTGICFNCGKKSLQPSEQNQMMLRDRKSLLDF